MEKKIKRLEEAGFDTYGKDFEKGVAHGDEVIDFAYSTFLTVNVMVEELEDLTDDDLDAIIKVKEYIENAEKEYLEILESSEWLRERFVEES